MRKPTSVVVMMGIGALLAGVIACGPASPGGGGAVTEAPATASSGNSGAPAVSSMPAVEPCTIVTQDEATALLGTPSGAGEPSVGSVTAECDYRPADNSAGLSLILAFVQDGSAANSSQFDYMKQGHQDVPGLGEGATWLADVGQLDVAKGSWILTLNGSIKGKPVSLDAFMPLAQTAIGRLP